jgi:type VI protein secretion system component Hcp
MAGDQKYFFLNMISAGVHGGSPKAAHLDWIELDNWDFSMNQTADPNVKGGRPSKTSATGRFGFSIVHNGPMLFKLAASGQYIGDPSPIVFEAERSGLTSGGGSTGTGVYLQLIFSKAVVSHRSLSGDDGQKMEHIELVFEKVSMTYKQVVKGVLGPAMTKTYDAKTNRVT